MCLGVGLGLPVAFGDAPVALMFFPALAVVLVAAVPVPRGERPQVFALGVSAFALRLALGATLFYASLVLGRGGGITGDDSSYARLAWAVARFLRGEPDASLVPPLWGGDAYLLNAFTYLEAALFLVIGPVPLAAIFLNASFGAAAAEVAYAIARRLWRPGEALFAGAVVAGYPSLVLWSSLNLKDPLVFVLIAVVLLIAVAMRVRQRPMLLVALALTLLPLYALRNYVFFGLAALVPGSLLIGTAFSRFPRRRLRWSLATLAVSAGVTLIVTIPTAAGFSLIDGLAQLETTRVNMSTGRTGFVEPTPLAVREGDTYVVTTTDAAATPGAGPTPSPRVVVVPPGARIVLYRPSFASSPPDPNVFVVRPGDIIVVSRAPSTGTAVVSPAPSPRELTITADRDVSTAPASTTDGSDAMTLTRTLAHVPKGVAYALLAPFPWDIGRTLDLLTVPEMLLWYVALAMIPVVLLRHRRRWQLLLPLVLYSAGLLGLFALAEGNVGTLYRHRAMVIPFIFVLSAPAWVDLARRLRSASRSVRTGARAPR